MNFKMKPDNNKMYSAREALQFFPALKNELSMRKFIEEDITTENLLHATIITRGKQRRFFIKGDRILKMITKRKKNE